MHFKGNGGWELNFGWSDTKQRLPKELGDWISKHDRQDLYSPVRLFAPTPQQYDNWVKFEPLVRRMDAVFHKLQEEKRTMSLIDEFDAATQSLDRILEKMEEADPADKERLEAYVKSMQVRVQQILKAILRVH